MAATPIGIGFRSFLATLIFLFSPSLAYPQPAEGVLARCGASNGHAYFFFDKLTNPGGPNWSEDGIPEGSILLVRLGDEWDIQFGDVVGKFGYRQDGAEVVVLGATDGKLTVAAVRGTYTDIYTFNFSSSEVLWSSHKVGTLITKVGLYRAECSFVNPQLKPD